MIGTDGEPSGIGLVRGLLLVVLTAVGVVIVPFARPAAADPGPPLETARELLDAALECPSTLGAGDSEPVLLVHGTGTNPEESWSWSYLPALQALGFEVCTVRLPERALVDIQTSSEYVVHAIRSMAAATGGKVDVIGHSQGALQPRWAIKYWPDIAGLVDDYISLAGANHGVSMADFACDGGECPPAIWQLRHAPSDLIAALNDDDETPGDVSYTSIWSETDELVQPVDPPTAELEGASNIRIQALCPGRPVHHVGILHDPVTWSIVIDTLTRAGLADPDAFDPATCAELSVMGMDPASGNALLYSQAALAMFTHPRVDREPLLRSYVTGTPSPGGPADVDPTPQLSPGPPEERGETTHQQPTLPATGGASPPLASVAALLVLALVVSRRTMTGSTARGSFDELVE